MSAADLPLHSGAVLIPVKAFDRAKVRLSSALESHDRALLARRMATRVVQAQQGTPVAICCDDAAVAEWAESVGATSIWCPGTGLNGAVQQGVAELRDRGFRAVAIAHSDLPLAVPLERLMGWPGITIVPDRHRSGTNVMALPTSTDFTFQYGIGSFHAHVREAVRRNCGLRIVHDTDLGWDVDRPDDLDLPDDLLATLLSTESAR